MAVKSKAQLAADIAALGSTYNEAAVEALLNDMVDSYNNLIAQVTTAQRNALTPTTGLVVYNTDTARQEYWNGTAWFAVGQNVYTPVTLPFSLTSADILALNSTPYEIAPAPGAGFAIVPISITYIFTPGGTQYSGSYNVEVVCDSNVGDSNVAFTTISSLVINAASRRSGGLPTNSGTSIDAIVENDPLMLYATNAPTLGNGTLSGVITYSVIPI